MPVGVEGLRLVGRLEGGVSVKAESTVSPSLLYNRYNDSVALMDAARTGTIAGDIGKRPGHVAGHGGTTHPQKPITRHGSKGF